MQYSNSFLYPTFTRRYIPYCIPIKPSTYIRALLSLLSIIRKRNRKQTSPKRRVVFVKVTRNRIFRYPSDKREDFTPASCAPYLISQSAHRICSYYIKLKRAHATPDAMLLLYCSATILRYNIDCVYVCR